MSRDEELFELSAVYHGQREYVEELRQRIASLEQALKEAWAFIDELPDSAWSAQEREKLRASHETVHGQSLAE